MTSSSQLGALRRLRELVTIRLVGLMLLAVAVAACGSQTTIPVEDARLGNDLPTTAGHASEEVYASPAALAAASDDVVVGEVTSVVSIGTPDAFQDPNPSEYFILGIRPDVVLKGSPNGDKTIAWEGFITDGEGTRTLRVTRNGVNMPDEGDRLLLFLTPESPDRVAFFENATTHRVNTLDGILYVDDNDQLVTTLVGTGRPAHQLAGETLDALPTLIELDE